MIPHLVRTFRDLEFLPFRQGWLLVRRAYLSAETMSASPSPAPDDLPAAFGLHSGSKAVRSFSFDYAGLICPLHKSSLINRFDNILQTISLA